MSRSEDKEPLILVANNINNRLFMVFLLFLGDKDWDGWVEPTSQLNSILLEPANFIINTTLDYHISHVVFVSLRKDTDKCIKLHVFILLSIHILYTSYLHEFASV